jgi:uncharacterized protein YlzI (FlbEa/FlbD family)
MSIKSNLKELLDKHADWFKKHDVKLSIGEDIEIKLAATAKAADGSEIGTPTEFVAGAEVFVVIEGQPTPAPDGEIVMEDGTTVVVKEGKIEDVREKVEEMSDDSALVIEQLIQRVDALEASNATQATELSTANEKIADLNTKLSAAEKKAADAQAKVVELSKQPATRSVKDKAEVELKKETTKNQKTFEQMTHTERVLAKMN